MEVAIGFGVAIIGVAALVGVALLIGRKGYRHQERRRIQEEPLPEIEILGGAPVTVPPSNEPVKPLTRFELLMKQYDCQN